MSIGAYKADHYPDEHQWGVTGPGVEFRVLETCPMPATLIAMCEALRTAYEAGLRAGLIMQGVAVMDPPPNSIDLAVVEADARPIVPDPDYAERCKQSAAARGMPMEYPEQEKPDEPA